MQDDSGSPYAASLSADFTTSSTSAADVTGLAFPVGANEIWLFDFRLNIGKASGTAGIKMALSWPTGATVKGMVWGSVTPATPTYQNSIITASGTLTTEVYQIVANSNGIMRIWGRIANGSTPGLLQLQVATVSSQNEIIVAGSGLVANRQA